MYEQMRGMNSTLLELSQQVFIDSKTWPILQQMKKNLDNVLARQHNGQHRVAITEEQEAADILLKLIELR